MRSTRRGMVAGFCACFLVLGILPLPAWAVTVDVAIAVASDGGGSFTPGDGPGLDSGPANGVVRTNDTIAYHVDVNATDGLAINETVTLTAPPNAAWTQVPGSALDLVRVSRATS